MEEYKRLSSEDIEKILAKEFPGYRCGQAKPAPVWLYGESVNLSKLVMHSSTDQEMNAALGKSDIIKKAAEEQGLPCFEAHLRTEETDFPHRDYSGNELKVQQLVRRVRELREDNQDYGVVIGYAGDSQVFIQYEDGNQCRVMSYHLHGLCDQAPEELRLMSQQFTPEDLSDLGAHDSFERLQIMFAKNVVVHYTKACLPLYHQVLMAIDQINPKAKIESVNEDLKNTLTLAKKK